MYSSETEPAGQRTGPTEQVEKQRDMHNKKGRGDVVSAASFSTAPVLCQSADTGIFSSFTLLRVLVALLSISYSLPLFSLAAAYSTTPHMGIKEGRVRMRRRPKQQRY
uniref:Uncharacterized protein n=1 Tax=Trypanosoma vivax (strain Y486) TaxID=1055687 RepID=G0TY06_TRYVY|nr:hypothetical protein, unlikely [Trypanosoma vivax Y486]